MLIVLYIELVSLHESMSLLSQVTSINNTFVYSANFHVMHRICLGWLIYRLPIYMYKLSNPWLCPKSKNIMLCLDVHHLGFGFLSWGWAWPWLARTVLIALSVISAAANAGQTDIGCEHC